MVKLLKCAKMASCWARESENLPTFRYQWADLWIYRSTNQAIDLATYQFTNLTNNQSANQSGYRPINLTIYQSINLPIYPSINPSANVWIYQSSYQSTNLEISHINALSIYRSTNLLDNEGSPSSYPISTTYSPHV